MHLNGMDLEFQVSCTFLGGGIRHVAFGCLDLPIVVKMHDF